MASPKSRCYSVPYGYSAPTTTISDQDTHANEQCGYHNSDLIEISYDFLIHVGKTIEIS